MKTDLSRQLETRLVRGNIPRSFDVSDEKLRDDAGKVRRSACARQGQWAHAKSKAAGFFPVAEPRQR
jgi:acyl-CoA synthetase (AMP-forming)/AMP-acid ligase II